MYGLITNRTMQNVSRRDTLAKKGWSQMTVAEQIEWRGNPLEITGANLLPPGPHYSSSIEVNHDITEIITTATVAGSYLFSVLIIGDATNFAGKKLTLSLTALTKTAGNPRIALYWHDDNGGSDYAGVYIADEGSVTVDTASYPNTNNRAHLAAYVYATYDTPVSVGAKADFSGAMLEIGDTRHGYVCYSEIAPTAATKGAYNYSDLNRVERAVAEYSRKQGMSLTTKTDWTMWDVPQVADMARFLSNIKTIRDSIGNSITLPDSMNGLTYTNANNIEKILEKALIMSSSDDEEPGVPGDEPGEDTSSNHKYVQNGDYLTHYIDASDSNFVNDAGYGNVNLSFETSSASQKWLPLTIEAISGEITEVELCVTARIYEGGIYAHETGCIWAVDAEGKEISGTWRPKNGGEYDNTWIFTPDESVTSMTIHVYYNNGNTVQESYIRYRANDADGDGVADSYIRIETVG